MQKCCSINVIPNITSTSFFSLSVRGLNYNDFVTYLNYHYSGHNTQRSDRIVVLQRQNKTSEQFPCLSFSFHFYFSSTCNQRKKPCILKLISYRNKFWTRNLFNTLLIKSAWSQNCSKTPLNLICQSTISSLFFWFTSDLSTVTLQEIYILGSLTISFQVESSSFSKCY